MSAVKNPEYPDLSQVGYSQTKLNIEHIDLLIASLIGIL